MALSILCLTQYAIGIIYALVLILLHGCCISNTDRKSCSYNLPLFSLLIRDDDIHTSYMLVYPYYEQEAAFLSTPLTELLYLTTLYPRLWTYHQSTVVGLRVLPHMVGLAKLLFLLILNLALRVRFLYLCYRSQKFESKLFIRFRQRQSVQSCTYVPPTVVSVKGSIHWFSMLIDDKLFSQFGQSER